MDKEARELLPQVWAGMQDPMVPMVKPVTAVHHENHDCFTLTLDGSGHPGGLCFQPGQFSMLYVFGVGEVPISISGDPSNPTRLVHTVRAVGTVTDQMQKLQVGDSLGVRGPFGQPWPIAELRGRDIILVAGGIGLAPLRPLIYQLLRERKNFGKFAIYYGARSAADLLFSDLLRQWQQDPSVDFRLTVDHAGGSWQGKVGVVTQLLNHFTGRPKDTLALICGPEVMMRFAIRELNALGVTDDRIFLSMERNMHCATGFCGHCQFGPSFICKDGPVFRFTQVKRIFGVREC